MADPGLPDPGLPEVPPADPAALSAAMRLIGLDGPGMGASVAPIVQALTLAMPGILEGDCRCDACVTMRGAADGLFLLLTGHGRPERDG